MKYLQQAITEFSYSTLVNDYDDYNPATTYVLEVDDENLTNASVVRLGNFYYRSLINDNVGFDPVEFEKIKWVKWAVANKYAMIDLASTTASSASGTDIVVEFPRGLIDTLTLGYYTAREVLVEHLNDLSGVVSGLTVPTSASLTSSILEGLVYVSDTRIDHTTTEKVFTASVDTYVDIDIDGVLVYTEVALGAGEPTLTAPNQRLAKVVTDGSTVASVTDMRTIIVKVIADVSQSITHSVNETIYDLWDYIYDAYSEDVNRALKVDLSPIGTSIRVTLKPVLVSDTVSMGYLVGGEALFMGETLYGVGFNFQSYAYKEVDTFGTLTVIKRNVQDLVDFETIIPTAELSKLKRRLKSVYNDILVFIVDESDDSQVENLLTLGIVENASVVLSNPVLSTMTWSIMESL